MAKRVLDVGQCDPDHANIKAYLTARFDVTVDRTHGPDEALEALGRNRYDLVLVNRLLDRDGSEGTAILRSIKADPRLAETPVMLVTNYPEHQDAAVASGAVYGFGKAELDKPQTEARLRSVLG